MAEPFLGEIKLVPYTFAPRGWAMCDGQLLPINQNQGLFALLGTMYGGNGQTNFALPNAQGRTLVGVGNGFSQGQVGGEQAHTLLVSEIPAHNHSVATGGVGTSTDATGNLLGAPVVATMPQKMYGTTANVASGPMLAPAGGNQPHDNMQPYLTLSYVIALIGIFPSR